MTRKVVLTDEAHRNAESAYSWYVERSPESARKWWNAFLAALTAVEQYPERYPTARENEQFPVTLRQINFGGGRRRTHRLLYVIREDHTVVYAVRHLAQRDVVLDDLVE
jgi:plasmid stabilization system protein ParE